MASVVARVLRGAAAGLVGTLAMDLLWWSRYRRAGGEGGFLAWDLATDVASFEEVSAPGKVGQRAAAAVGVRLPDEAAATTTNLVHWSTGAGYGAAHALALGGRRGGIGAGLVTGLGAFANSYATLGLLGIYAPIWRYGTATLARDLSAHLLFGAGVGVTHATLSPSDDG